MVLSKQDLADWNSHPVTKEIFKGIRKAIVELKEESTVMATCDETAMKASRNEGIAEGASAIFEAYEMLVEDV